MAWITLTEDDIITKLSGPEIAAMKSAARQAEQEDPLPPVIEQVVREIRGYVAGCPRNTLGAGETIPDELLGAAISRIRFELATRLPVASLLTEDRRAANANVLQLLRDVAACRFLVVPADEAAEDQASGPATEVITTTTRRFTRDSMEGL